MRKEVYNNLENIKAFVESAEPRGERDLSEFVRHIVSCRVKADFLSFVERSFEELNPGKKYKHNWHIEEICNYLIDVYYLKTRRLIINMPPRHLKSLCVSVCFVAWILGHDPSKRVIVSSYSIPIAIKHSLDTKKIMKSEWYRNAFPETKIARGENTKQKFVTEAGGFRFATSSSSSLTGEGGDILIVDDPHKPATICSKLQREKVADWFCNTLLSRLDDRKTGAIIIVMQRLHEEDLTGVLLEKNGASWKVLVLKAIATEDEKFRKQGEVIHSERDSLEEMMELKREMGDLRFETQYQQEPRMQGRGLIKEETVIIEELETSEKDDYCVFSVDSASKIGLSADFTAITIWGVRKEKLYLKDCYKVKFEFGELLRFIKFLLPRFNPSFVLIEDKASGIALIQELKRVNFGGKVVDIRVKYDKVVRFLSCLPLFEGGKVVINGKIPILKEIKEELLNFPFVKHDDIVDSISQFLNWYLKRWQGEAFAGVRVRRL